MYAEAHDFRIEVGYKNPKLDPSVQKLKMQAKKNFGLTLKNIEIVKVFLMRVTAREQQIKKVAEEVLTDKIIQRYTVNSPWTDDYNFLIERKFKPGISDNEAKTAREQIGLFLGRKLREDEWVKTALLIVTKGLVQKKVNELAEIIANPLIHDTIVYSKGSLPLAAIETATSDKNRGKVETINLYETLDGNFEASMRRMSMSYWELLTLSTKELMDLGLKKRTSKDDDLKKLSDRMTLSLTSEELKIFREYFERPQIKKKRAAIGLEGPTDVELEAFAQTQSEHCKHKIFNAQIEYSNRKNSSTIKSLFNTYIKSATENLSNKRKDLVSVFKDNAGIINFDEKYNLCFKVETHNAPSALDPFGGAETGIVGVNRDVLGAGLGAKPIANTDVFCLANPFYKGSLPPGVLHPWRIFEGVREGVESGGNKSGIPTINGAYFFDDRYLGKPLVFCGTIGIMPKKVAGKNTSIKKAEPGDKIFMVGGRIGKDGIHGATFSSIELSEESPQAAVQIGDPITQKKMLDVLLEARDLELIKSITDNGAGGLSSSIGEMALQSGGCEIDIASAPLKYHGLVPWEILLSEAQERMTVAIEPSNVVVFSELMKLRGVEATLLGEFTNSGMFHIKYAGKTAAFIDLEFLHNGLPPLKLVAEANYVPKPLNKKKVDLSKAMLTVLSDLSVCSKEYTIRQYDHEVQAGTIIKPLVGPYYDGPSDASVLKPVFDSWKGIVVSNGLCPALSKFNAYSMAQCALDEAVRNAICVGADPKSIVLLDNFCWPDPVFSQNGNQDGKHKLAQLVDACRGIYDAAIEYETPIISGKASMKNDFRFNKGNKTVKISVPPTLWISAMGTIRDVRLAVTMDAKCPVDFVFVVGLTKNHLAGSIYA
ncbi:MAG: AIR synthase-related protein, partial [Nanoarchaeota archaeon]